MLLKRKIYGLAIGIVLSQLSIAKFLDNRGPSRFGDCPTCQAASQVPFPLGNSNTNLVAAINSKLASGSPTAFTHGNGLNSAMPDMMKAQDYLAAQNAEYAKRMPQPAAQAPFVVPQFVMPTQQRVDSFFSGSPNWAAATHSLMGLPVGPSPMNPAFWNF